MTTYRGLPQAGTLTGREVLQLAQEDGQSVFATIEQIAGAALRLMPPANAGNHGYVPVANRAHYPNNAFSSGSTTATTYRTIHYTRKGAGVAFPRLVYVNATLGASGEATGNAALTGLTASIEYAGVSYPVYFAGSRSTAIPLDGVVISDPVALYMTGDTQFAVRSRPVVETLGEKWCIGQAMQTGIGESFSASDLVDSVASVGANAAGSFGPAAILGQMGSAGPTVAYTGSSSGTGQGDTAEAPYYDQGYLARALMALNQTGGDFAYIKMTRASTTLAMFLAGNTRQMNFLRLTRPTHIIQQLGSNDISGSASFATMQSRLRSVAAMLRSTGAKVYQCTFTPGQTTSSDSYLTVAGQTVAATNAVRVLTNNWLRTNPPEFDGIIECCDVAESSRDSGKWAVDGTTTFLMSADGLHLSQYGHRMTAAAIAPQIASLLNK
jgi:lysophospholipase L1-like esterase